MLVGDTNRDAGRGSQIIRCPPLEFINHKTLNLKTERKCTCLLKCYLVWYSVRRLSCRAMTKLCFLLQITFARAVEVGLMKRHRNPINTERNNVEELDWNAKYKLYEDIHENKFTRWITCICELEHESLPCRRVTRAGDDQPNLLLFFLYCFVAGDYRDGEAANSLRLEQS